MNKTQRKITAGSYVQLGEDINCIPKGVYRVTEVSAGALELRVGRTIHIMIFNYQGSAITPLSRTDGLARATTVAEFESRYAELLHESRSAQPCFDPHKPFTMCVITPRSKGPFSKDPLGNPAAGEKSVH